MADKFSSEYGICVWNENHVIAHSAILHDKRLIVSLLTLNLFILAASAFFVNGVMHGKNHPCSGLSWNGTCPRTIRRTCSDTSLIHRNILDTPVSLSSQQSNSLFEEVLHYFPFSFSFYLFSFSLFSKPFGPYAS